jgi:uncharacterized transporter YbjL
MSIRTKDEEFSFMWLAFAGLLVVALVFGFLRAGRLFWKLSSSANESSVSART